MHRILLIDDDERLRDLLQRFLVEHGFLVTTATDAADARGILKYLAYDLIICDVMMPGEDGLSICRRLRAALAWAKTRPARAQNPLSSWRLGRPAQTTAARGGRAPAPPTVYWLPCPCAPQTTVRVPRHRVAHLWP